MNLLLLFAFVLILGSCQKEPIETVKTNGESAVEDQELANLLSDYPKEITLENWEEFVEAPQAVIDHFEELEFQKNQTVLDANDRPTAIDRSNTNGLVQAFGFSWRAIDDVTVIAPTCQNLVTTNSNQSSNYTLTCSDGISCMEYVTTAANGVTTFDLVKIQRHILGLEPFTLARQFLSADANRSGTISAFDIVLIQKVVARTSFVYTQSDNIVFVTNEDYNELQGTIGAGGIIDNSLLLAVGKTSACLNIESAYRRAIKTGDVTGNFNF